MIFLAFDFKIRYNLMRENLLFAPSDRFRFYNCLFYSNGITRSISSFNKKFKKDIKIYNEIFPCILPSIFFSPDPFFSFRLDLNLSVDLTNRVFDCWNWKYLGCDESSSTYFELHTEAIKKKRCF